jgi:hypothetical protein
MCRPVRLQDVKLPAVEHSQFVTQLADVCPEYLARILCAPLALFFEETERRDDASMTH